MIPLAPSFVRRLAAGACTVGTLLPTPVLAGPGPPSPANSTVPCAISVVAAPAAAPIGEFTVIIRDISNYEVPDVPVVIDFSGCGNDIRLAAQQLPGTVVDCAARTLTRITDAQGRATFRIIAGSSGAPSSVGHACAAVLGPDVYGTFGLLANVQVSVFDLDSQNGLTAADLSRFMGDFFSCPVPPAYCARCDYNFEAGACITQELTSADLSMWLDAFFVPGGTWATPLCPP